VSMQQLSVPEPTQPDLFGPDLHGTAPGRQALERTIDAVRARFGVDAGGSALRLGSEPASSRVEPAPAVRENGNG
jgi:hypothetical protein